MCLALNYSSIELTRTLMRDLVYSGSRINDNEVITRLCNYISHNYYRSSLKHVVVILPSNSLNSIRTQVINQIETQGLSLSTMSTHRLQIGGVRIMFITNIDAVRGHSLDEIVLCNNWEQSIDVDMIEQTLIPCVLRTY